MMRKYVLLFAAGLLVASCTSTDSDVVEQTIDKPEKVRLGNSYGPEKVDHTAAVSVEEMLAEQESSEGEKEYTFVGVITETCSKAGCWVNIDKGDGTTFMVRFKDHFTIPTDTKPGTKAFFHGVAMNDTVSVELLRHFAEDAGKSQEEIEQITEPKPTISFIADGIVLAENE